MKKYLLQILFIFLANNLRAQYFNWAANAISSDNIYTYYSPPNILTDATGSIYTIGNFYGTVDFDPGPGTYYMSSYYSYPNTYSNLYILKQDALGNFIWARSFNGAGHYYAYKLAIDSALNVYAAGLFEGKIDFNPGSATNYINSLAGNVFIAKLDKNGDFKWAKQLEALDEIEINSIVVDSKENVYTTGQFYGQLDVDPGPNRHYLMAYNDNMFISKLDSGGNFVWGQQLYSKNGISKGMMLKVDSKDNLILSGQFAGVVDFDPSTSNYEMTAGAWDMFVMQLDKYGNFSWAKKFGGNGTEKPSSLDMDSLGSIYVTGTFEQKADFDPGTNVANLTSKGGQDVFIVKLNDSGDLLWARSLGDRKDEYTGSITVDRSFNVYISGSFIDTVDFDPGSGKQTLISKPKPDDDGSEDIFILKLSANGNFNWVQHYGESGADRAISSIIDKKGNLFTMGKFAEEVDFDPDTGTFFLKASVKGYSTGFILRLSQCQLAIPSDIKGPSKVCSNSTHIYETDSTDGEYFWELPPGATIKNNKNSHKIEVTFGSSSGSISLRLKTECGMSKTKFYDVMVNPLPYIGANILPNPTPCEGALIAFRAYGAHSYIWSDGITDGVLFKAQKSGNYSVIGIDKNGCKGNGSVFLFVNPSPEFSDTVADQSLAVGSVATFEAQTSRDAKFYYWQQNSGMGFVNLENFGQISGAKTKTLKIKNINSAQDNFGYRCVAQTGSCYDTSNIAKLWIGCTIEIENQPQNALVDVGESAQFQTSTANNTDEYQWQVKLGSEFVNLSNLFPYSGTHSKLLQISNVSLAMHNLQYRCIITNESCGDTTEAALLETACRLYFTDQPNDQKVLEGSEVNFTSVSGISNTTYQWQQNSGAGFADLSDFGQYSGTKTETLKITNVNSSLNNFGFRCIISESGCTDTSNNATLKVMIIGYTSPLKENALSVFPNPAYSYIMIQSTKAPKDISYSILDQTGREVLFGQLNKKSELINISDLAPGFYFVRINDALDVFKLLKL